METDSPGAGTLNLALVPYFRLATQGPQCLRGRRPTSAMVCSRPWSSQKDVLGSCSGFCALCMLPERIMRTCLCCIDCSCCMRFPRPWTFKIPNRLNQMVGPAWTVICWMDVLRSLVLAQAWRHPSGRSSSRCDARCFTFHTAGYRTVGTN